MNLVYQNTTKVQKQMSLPSPSKLDEYLCVTSMYMCGYIDICWGEVAATVGSSSILLN